MQETIIDRTREAMRRIQDCKTLDEIEDEKDRFIGQCVRNGEVPFLSDLIVNISNGAQPLMEALGEREIREMNLPDDQRFRWQIQALRDEWGNVPQPGDSITRTVFKNLTRSDGRPRGSTELSRAKVDGSFEQKFQDHFRYELDEKGCATCGFTAAAYFLNVYGVHCVTGRGMTTKPELSSGPSKAPNGQMLHVHYWRYKEAPAHLYADLPTIPKTETPKRGK